MLQNLRKSHGYHHREMKALEEKLEAASVYADQQTKLVDDLYTICGIFYDALPQSALDASTASEWRAIRDKAENK